MELLNKNDVLKSIKYVNIKAEINLIFVVSSLQHHNYTSFNYTTTKHQLNLNSCAVEAGEIVNQRLSISEMTRINQYFYGKFNIKVYYQNVRGLRTKMKDIKNIII